MCHMCVMAELLTINAYQGYHLNMFCWNSFKCFYESQLFYIELADQMSPKAILGPVNKSVVFHESSHIIFAITIKDKGCNNKILFE